MAQINIKIKKSEVFSPAYKSTTVSPLQSNPATRSFSVMFPAENMHLVTSNSYLKQDRDHLALPPMSKDISHTQITITDWEWPHLIPLSTCLTQLWSPNSIVTTGDLNPFLDMWLIFARRFALRHVATASHSCRSKNVQHKFVAYLKKLTCGEIWGEYLFSSRLAGKNICLPAGLSLHAAGICKEYPSSAPLSIFLHETPTAAGGFALVY